MQDLILDVKGKTLGRAASQAAILLRGKNRVDFEARLRPRFRLIVKNLSGLKIFQKKMKGEFYKHYTGYPGGLKQISLDELWAKKPREVFRHAVWGMLPKNRSRKEFIKNLKFE